VIHTRHILFLLSHKFGFVSKHEVRGGNFAATNFLRCGCFLKVKSDKSVNRAEADIYWQERMSQCFNSTLTGARCIALGPFYNVQLYKVRLKALEKGIATIGRSFKGSTVLEVGCGAGFY